MTVERITLPAIRISYPDGGTRHFVPLVDPHDGAWWVLDEDGAGVWQGAADVRRFADEWAQEVVEMGLTMDREAEDLAGYRALAELLDELEQTRPAGGVQS